MRLLAAVSVALLLATGCEDPSARPAARSTTSPPARPSATRPSTAARATTPAARPTPVKARVLPPRPKPVAPAPPKRTTAAPKPLVASTCGAPANPWGYNFCGRGSVITSPPASFCDYFDCIDSFWENTRGHVMRCEDGMYSHSGGRRGSCSHHDGNDRPLYG